MKIKIESLVQDSFMLTWQEELQIMSILSP